MDYTRALWYDTYMDQPVPMQDAASALQVPQPESSPKNTRKFLLSGLIVLVFIGLLVGIMYFTPKKTNPSLVTQNSETSISQKTPTIVSQATNDTSLRIKTNSGLAFSILKTWSGKYYKNSFTQLFVELSDWKNADIKNSNTIPANYVQISLYTSQKKQTLSFLSITKTSEIAYGGVTFTKIEGKEAFSAKGRDFIRYSWSQYGKNYMLDAYAPNVTAYESQLNTLIQSMANTTSYKPTHSSFFSLFLNKAYAQEATPSAYTQFDATPSGQTGQSTPSAMVLPKELQIEASPVEAQFSSEDSLWKGNRAHAYIFSALAGQRLTTIAVEEGSDITSDLYKEDGTTVKEELDTRIEFTVPETGRYKLIVRNIKNASGKYTVKIQDRDQSDVVIKLKKYDDGAELFFPPETELADVPFSTFAYKIIPNKVIEPQNIQPVVYALSGTKEQFLAQAFFPEDTKENIVKTHMTQLEDGSLLVEPDTKQFPRGSQLVLSFPLGQGGYIYRTFTQ